MQEIRYFRLMHNNLFVGFKRIIIEYLEPGVDHWQLEPIKHDESFVLDSPPPGIETMKRAKIRRESGEDSKDEKS